MVATMEATLVEQPRSGSRSDRETELSALVADLRNQSAKLRDEVASLRQQVGYWKSMHARAVAKNRKLEEENDNLRAENRKLKAKLYGRRTEKTKPKDRSNHLDDPQEKSEESKRDRGHQPNQPGPGRRDYSHLAAVEETVALPPEECICPKCGKLRGEMTETEDSEVIEIEVRAHRRRVRRKRYRSTCDCPDVPCTITAPAVPKLIPKGRYGISVWVHVLLSKFGSHRATGNLIDELKQYDLDLPPGTVTGGLKRLVPLLEPIYEALLRSSDGGRESIATDCRRLPKSKDEIRSGRWYGKDCSRPSCNGRCETRRLGRPGGRYLVSWPAGVHPSSQSNRLDHRSQ